MVASSVLFARASAVDLAPVANAHLQDHQPDVLDGIDDPVVADPVIPELAQFRQIGGEQTSAGSGVERWVKQGRSLIYRWNPQHDWI